MSRSTVTFRGPLIKAMLAAGHYPQGECGDAAGEGRSKGVQRGRIFTFDIKKEFAS